MRIDCGFVRQRCRVAPSREAMAEGAVLLRGFALPVEANCSRRLRAIVRRRRSGAW